MNVLERKVKNKHKKADFIMVDHNLYGLKLHCDKAFLLNDGNLIQFDNLEEGIENHKRILLEPPKQTE